MGRLDGTDADRLWIFAYGSLMWRPEFPSVSRVRARLPGYHRSLCIVSSHWRGTRQRPGLVLGLDRGGSCVGVAFEIAPERRAATLEAVRAREMIGGVYHELTLPVAFPDGSRRPALAYVADRRHPDYAGRLDRDAILARVRDSVGVAGRNADYVRNSYAHMRDLGLRDLDLAWVVAALDGIEAAA